MVGQIGWHSCRALRACDRVVQLPGEVGLEFYGVAISAVTFWAIAISFCLPPPFLNLLSICAGRICTFLGTVDAWEPCLDRFACSFACLFMTLLTLFFVLLFASSVARLFIRVFHAFAYAAWVRGSVRVLVRP